jgi:predicted unusual protein kinase regulating ubiquinone biosynthesis (AarF/ABC1/UbiB family)
MHATGYTHMDLHEENIMRAIDTKGQNKFAFIDFGMANRLEETFLSKNTWRKNELRIQQAAEEIIGKKVDVKEFQEMVDESRIYAYTLEGAGLRDVSSKVHVSFNQIIKQESNEIVDDSIRTILQASKEARQLFDNANTNMQISTNISVAKAVRSGNSTAVQSVISDVRTKPQVAGTLQQTIDQTALEKSTAAQSAMDRQERFRLLARSSVAAGAKSGHRAGRRHSTINSTKTV